MNNPFEPHRYGYHMFQDAFMVCDLGIWMNGHQIPSKPDIQAREWLKKLGFEEVQTNLYEFQKGDSAAGMALLDGLGIKKLPFPSESECFQAIAD